MLGENNAPLGIPGGATEELWTGGFRYYRDNRHFPLGMDSVLLAAFARVRRGLRVADLGTGCGYIPLMLLGWESSLKIDALEIVPSAVGAAVGNVRLNKLEECIRVLEGDLREIQNHLPHAGYGLVICNPPYYSPNSGRVSEDATIGLARSRGCTVEEVCRAASYLLKNGGSVCLCWKPERMTELFSSLSLHGLEPKRLRFCQSAPGQAPYLLLLEARKQARPGLSILPNLIVRDGSGAYTQELLRMYHRPSE